MILIRQKIQIRPKKALQIRKALLHRHKKILRQKKSNTTQSKKNSLSKKSASSHVTNNSSTTKTSSKLLVHFIDVGQGDSILITQGKHAMLIDAGNNDKGTTVQLYLKKQGLTSLDYVIGTHPDADHIGGLDVVIYKFDCKRSCYRIARAIQPPTVMC